MHLSWAIWSPAVLKLAPKDLKIANFGWRFVRRVELIVIVTTVIR